MTLRRETLSPTQRRPPRNPITLILALLLLATLASTIRENRTLRARAADEQREVEKLQREIDVLKQLDRLRPRTREHAPNPGAGDFAVPPDGPRTL